MLLSFFCGQPWVPIRMVRLGFEAVVDKSLVLVKTKN